MAIYLTREKQSDMEKHLLIVNQFWMSILTTTARGGPRCIDLTADEFKVTKARDAAAVIYATLRGMVDEHVENGRREPDDATYGEKS